MLNAVLDTNVLVSGLISAYGNPAQIINAFKEKRFNFIYNDEILREYRDVLFRSKLGLNSADVNDLIGEIIKAGFSVIPEKSKISLPDEDDRIFYDTAKTAGAYLVTGNIKHYPNEPTIITPAEFLKLIINSEV